MEKEKKPIYKKWWFWVIAVIIVGALASGDDEEEPEEVTEPVEEIEEEQDEPEEEEPEIEEPTLTDDEINELEDGLADRLETDLTIHTFDFEDERLTVWIDMQIDPLPTDLESEDIIADVTWYLAEQNDVVDHSNYQITATLVTEVDDGYIHWLTERYADGEYDMSEGDGYDILPKE